VLYLDGAEARVALASATDGNSALTMLAGNLGTLRLDGGAVVSTTVDFANSGLVEIDDAGGGSWLTIGGTLTNSAVGPDGIDVGNANLSAATVVEAAAFANTGEINLTGARSVQATLDITGAAPVTLTGVNNLVNDALLEYGKGPVTAIGSGATLYLDGAEARVALASAAGSNSALTMLASIAGTLRPDGGAVVGTTASLSNTGLVEVDDVVGSGGSRLTIGATLTNSAADPDGLKIGNTSLSAPRTVRRNFRDLEDASR
jgi:hypothetical protein